MKTDEDRAREVLQGYMDECDKLGEQVRSLEDTLAQLAEINATNSTRAADAIIEVAVLKGKLAIAHAGLAGAHTTCTKLEDALRGVEMLSLQQAEVIERLDRVVAAAKAWSETLPDNLGGASRLDLIYAVKAYIEWCYPGITKETP